MFAKTLHPFSKTKQLYIHLEERISRKSNKTKIHCAKKVFGRLRIIKKIVFKKVDLTFSDHLCPRLMGSNDSSTQRSFSHAS